MAGNWKIAVATPWEKMVCSPKNGGQEFLHKIQNLLAMTRTCRQ